MRRILALLAAVSAIWGLAWLLCGAARVPATNNPLGGEAFWMPCDDTGSDAWIDDAAPGNQNRKLNTGSADSHTTTTAIVGGHAMAFSGASGDYLTVCSGNGDESAKWLESLTAAGKNFTIAFWFKMQWRNQSQYGMSLYDGAFGVPLLNFRTNSNGTTDYQNLDVGALPPTGAAWVWMRPGDATKASWDGIWFHVAVTRNGTLWKGYKNGSSISSDNRAGNDAAWYVSSGSASYRFVMGADHNLNSPGKVILDDFRIYPRALSDSEISALYNSGSGRSTPLARP